MSEWIRGVVAPPGAGGVAIPPEGRYTLHFTLDAWRDGAGTLHTDPLHVTEKIDDAQLDDRLNQLVPYALASLRVRTLGAGKAELLEVRPEPPEDAALSARAAALQVPVTIEHPRFGTLTHDRGLGRYNGRAKWQGRDIRLVLQALDDEQRDAAFAVADIFFRDQDLWAQRVVDRLLGEALPLKNDTWLQEGESPLTARSMLETIRLETIVLAGDGWFTFWYGDGDLFGGHSITVWGDTKSGVGGMMLEG